MKGQFKNLLIVFFSWRITLFILAVLGVYAFPAAKDFLGGGSGNYSSAPWFWGWANFDGERYIQIAQNGYHDLLYFFFPAFPLILGVLARALGGELSSYVASGLLVSNIALFFSLVGLWKLVRLDFSAKISLHTILIFLLFPTSFFFGAVYSESFFLALCVWAFYFARKRKWFWASLLAGVASATRIVGIGIFPAFLFEYFSQKERGPSMLFLGIVPLGLLIYMLFLRGITGDPFSFFRNVEMFGQQRSLEFTLLPQVLYRYVFKILPSIDFSAGARLYTYWLEFGTGVLFMLLSILVSVKLRVSYAIYTLIGYLTPTLFGSFSSMPRYVLVLFPAFILLALYSIKLSRLQLMLVYLVQFGILSLTTMLFIRGNWIA